MIAFLDDQPLLWVLVFFLGLCLPASETQAKALSEPPSSLTFAAIFIEEPPFIYTEGTSHYKGIIPEVAKALTRELNVRLDYQPTPRKRLEMSISGNEADFTWLSDSWVSSPESFVFSDTIMQHKEYLYSLSPFNTNTNAKVLDWVKDKTICVRQDYQYPSLDMFFKQSIAQAVWVSSQVPLMTLLLNKRCDLLYMNHHRASWMANALAIEQNLYRAPRSLVETELTFMFNKRWHSIMPQVNQAIRKIKRSGELSAIVQGHLHPEN